MNVSETTSERAPLRRASIVAAAIALADEEGVDALTMRNLAKRLGYEVMSLYNHVANKGELLGLMVDEIAAEIDDPPPDAAPLVAVRAIAVSTRAAFVNHRWAPDLWLRHLPGPARVGQMEQLLRLLDESGLSPELAHHGFHAVTNHVLGYTLQEREMTAGAMDPEDPDATAQDFLAGLDPEAHPHAIAHVREHLDGETASSFELVLDLIIDGLVALDALDEPSGRA